MVNLKLFIQHIINAIIASYINMQGPFPPQETMKYWHTPRNSQTHHLPNLFLNFHKLCISAKVFNWVAELVWQGNSTGSSPN